MASAINKIKAAEKEDQLRIEVLESKAESVAKQLLEQHVAEAVEKQVENHVSEHVARKIDEHGARIRDEYDQHLEHLELKHANVQKTFIQKAHEIAGNSGGGGAGWLTILFIVAGFGGIAYYLSRRVSRMEKNHLP